MGKFIDLTGQTFDRLTVLYDTGKKQRNQHIWHCKCICGNQCDVIGVSLREKRTHSCGCLKKESDKKTKNTWIDLTNQKFGHLTVIERVQSDKYGHARWKCKCDCQAQTQLIVTADNLRRGHTQSCGCDKRSHGELAIEKLLKANNINFIQEYQPFRFSSGMNARFDFYVNNQYIIEYDGETHYQYNLNGWHNKQQLQAQQQRDIIKNNWCKNNNIPLIRIPYWHLKDLTIKDLLLQTSQFIINK